MGKTKEAVVQTIWDTVEVTGFCWNWKGNTHKDGYGKVGTTRFGTRYAHRVVWFLLMDEEAPELDHLCFNPACVNPDHLEPVTHQLNTSRRRNNHGTTKYTFSCGHKREGNTVVWGKRDRCKVCG